MSGDPFKQVHERKTMIKEEAIKRAQKVAAQMSAINDRKRVLQPNEGQVLSFKDEEMRPLLQKMASQEHKEILEQQIREKQQTKSLQKSQKLLYEKQLAKADAALTSPKAKPRFRF